MRISIEIGDRLSADAQKISVYSTKRQAVEEDPLDDRLSGPAAG